MSYFRADRGLEPVGPKFVGHSGSWGTRCAQADDCKNGRAAVEGMVSDHLRRCNPRRGWGLQALWPVGQWTGEWAAVGLRSADGVRLSTRETHASFRTAETGSGFFEAGREGGSVQVG